MAKLDPEVFRQIRSICEHAGNLVQMGEEDFALSKYYEALTLVPDPKSDHSISTFIYTAMGEQYFKMKDYAEAGMCFIKAHKCPGGNEIAQISFRVGQCLEECGERKKAQDYLCQAYLLGGEGLFAAANPKYYKIIRSEVEGTLPEDDELDLLREADEYDIIDDILRSGSSGNRNSDYSGYSGQEADREVGLYSRSANKADVSQQRTSVEPDEDDYDDWDDDDDNDYDEQDDRDDGYTDWDEDDEEDGPVFSKSDDDYEEEKEPGFWSKLLSGIRKFVDLFK